MLADIRGIRALFIADQVATRADGIVEATHRSRAAALVEAVGTYVCRCTLLDIYVGDGGAFVDRITSYTSRANIRVSGPYLIHSL
jgi:hypothetical protein